MNTADNTPWHVPINAKLASIVASSAARPTWYRKWMALRPQSPGGQRLAVYRAIRDSGCLPPEAGDFLVSWQIDAMATDEADDALGPLERQLDEMRLAHGLGVDDRWPPGQAPPEYAALQRQYYAAWDELFAAKLEACGEQEMARLFRGDPQEFERQNEAGREFFHGSLPREIPQIPDWIEALVEAVGGHITADNAAGGLGYRCWEEEGLWELLIYPRPVELVGGAEDGAIVDPGFSLDLEGLRGEFEKIVACDWQALGFPEDTGPHVAIEGVYHGHEVFIQVLARAPDDEEPGMKLDTSPRPR